MLFDDRWKIRWKMRVGLCAMALMAFTLVVGEFASDAARLCEDNYAPPSLGSVFVGTLDGQITALDAELGSKRWKLQVGSPLLSSNIHRLELTNAGQWARLVPSLKGTLYRFSGESLEPLPLTVDQLLSSSYKYSDDLAIAGAKDYFFISVSTKTGHVIRECTVNGCKNNTDLLRDSGLGGEETTFDNIEETLIIHRTTQTVRAAEPRSGLEKWNFSVGQFDLKLPPIEGCILNTQQKLLSSTQLVYKIVVPEGIICAVQKNAPHNIVWKYKLKSPIVNAWHVENGELKPIDLFGVPFVPSVSDDLLHNSQPLITPTVYIGMHNRQLYIQESVRMQALVQSLSKPYVESDADKYSSLIIPWRPYPAKIVSESPYDSTALTSLNEKELSTTALSVLYASEYINGNGYYLYTDTDQKHIEDPKCNKMSSNTTDVANLNQKNDDSEFEWVDSENITIFVVSFWYWWKEVLAIALTTAVFLNVLCNIFRGRSPPQEVIKREYVIVERVENVPSPPSISSDLSLTPFVSRYLTDFTPLKCLGRGGFGVVFEAKNKIDCCSYAIKRITLPNQIEKREKVLREVRALAKLDHNNIVRYFNAWIEEPPSDWIDPFEKELKSSADITSTYSKHEIASSAVDTSMKKEKLFDNVFINMSSGSSVDEGYDALEYDKYLFGNNTLKRQRSQSANASVSIVFENNICDKENIQNIPSNSKKNCTTKENSENSSYIQFADSSKNSSFNAININNTSDCGNNNCNEDLKKSQVECIDESSQLKMSKKKRHIRNLSMESTNIKFNRRTSYENIYLYIQMQLCMEESLRDWLKKNIHLEIRKQQFIGIFEQIINAVEYVHLQGLIHRDLKPGNIFFSPEGQIKIGDFGLVTTMSDPFSNDIIKTNSNCCAADSVNDKHTKHVGTHLYMSPEQLRGEAHNFKVDIWSLGLVLVELLIPFQTEMERVVVLKALRDHQFPHHFDKQYPDEHELLRLMLSPEPSKRPTTFGVRAHAPFLHQTDPQYHYCLPSRSKNSSSSSF